MNAIIEYWRQQDRPELESWYIGWGEPFCFACGWLAPVRDGRKNSWLMAASWLDRAHLHDRWDNGSDEPSNIVALCHLCHYGMPAFFTGDGHHPTPADARDAAWQWVTDHERCEVAFQFWTDSRFLGKNHQPCRDTTLMRARMHYLEVVSTEARREIAKEENLSALHALHGLKCDEPLRI